MSLIRSRCVVPLLACGSLAAGTALAGAGMEPGLWELSMSANVSGKVETAPATRECVTQADIDDGTRVLPRPDGSCKLANVQRSPERATYEIAGDRYEGKASMNVTEAGAKEVPLLMTITARRVGDCTK